jgi:hypothetical protein
MGNLLVTLAYGLAAVLAQLSPPLDRAINRIAIGRLVTITRNRLATTGIGRAKW